MLKKIEAVPYNHVNHQANNLAGQAMTGMLGPSPNDTANLKSAFAAQLLSMEMGLVGAMPLTCCKMTYWINAR